MNKINSLIKLLFFLVANSLFAQVGIGTNSPKNSSILELSSTNKGFLLPRVDLSVLTSGSLTTFGLPGTNGEQEGMKVFNTSSTAPFSKGEYIWYNGKWNSFNSGVITASNGLTTIAGNVTLGGSLTQSTIVNQNTFPLQFKTGGINGFNITDIAATPNTIFSVDGANQRVGIGKSNPSTTLDVNNSSTTTGASNPTAKFLSAGANNSISINSAGGALIIGVNSGTAIGDITNSSRYLGYPGATGADIQLIQGAETATPKALLTARSSGNIGIGTVTPNKILWRF